ncbi:DUF2808 domain-containing protein [Pseudanabaena sp. FACHB-1998]|uniref:DUF2808 domain-containing protein n=1 Tax=Pseudanabaena sp. FACHB-1998 TaxID=2692858 RepID=UPI0016807376|nr:DUF2808 domain-containing protein [Pseudanabaena sp. FACHB-1998]MBD2178794.1 DUF2808 domain-containing protein [Pseudanabaena sp. FACHB-1998]
MRTNYFSAVLLSLLPMAFLGSITFAPQSVKSQNNFVLLGSGKEAALGYTIRTNRANARLNTINFFVKLPKSKAIAEIQIQYPQGFGNVFSPDNIRVIDRNNRKEVEIKEASIDREVGTVRFLFKEPIPSSNNREIEIISSGVSNPSQSGMYRIDLQALGTEANPLFQFIGQWLVNIN